MKRALIFNPYFDTLGGGEKYTSGVIIALLQQGFEVTVAWHDNTLAEKLSSRFGITLSVLIDPNVYNVLTKGSIIERITTESKFDLIFWVSDGSIPFLFGKRNFLHFQVPFSGLKKSPVDWFKWKMIHKIVCNSVFTKKVIDATYGVNSVVLYPPCTLIKPLVKEKIILSVGRFDGLLHSKRQDILIDAFKQLKLSGWKLVLAGGDMGQTDNLKQLKDSIGDSAIELFVNPDHKTIEKLYGQASLYWHAAGFSIDEQTEPERVEHFGISTVEAMSAGAVPLVYNAGGQREIVHNEENGFLWTTIDDLISKSNLIINSPQMMTIMAVAAHKTSEKFSMEHFTHDFAKL